MAKKTIRINVNVFCEVDENYELNGSESLRELDAIVTSFQGEKGFVDVGYTLDDWETIEVVEVDEEA